MCDFFVGGFCLVDGAGFGGFLCTSFYCVYILFPEEQFAKLL